MKMKMQIFIFIFFLIFIKFNLNIFAADIKLSANDISNTLPVNVISISDKKMIVNYNFETGNIKKITLNYGVNPWLLSEKKIITDTTFNQVILDKLISNTRYYVQLEIEPENRKDKKRLIPETPILVKTLQLPARELNKFTSQPQITVYKDTYVIDFTTMHASKIEVNYGNNRNSFQKKSEGVIFNNKHSIILNLINADYLYYQIKATNINDRVIEFDGEIKLPAGKNESNETERGIRRRMRKR